MLHVWLLRNAPSLVKDRSHSVAGAEDRTANDCGNGCADGNRNCVNDKIGKPSMATWYDGLREFDCSSEDHQANNH